MDGRNKFKSFQSKRLRFGHKHNDQPTTDQPINKKKKKKTCQRSFTLMNFHLVNTKKIKHSTRGKGNKGVLKHAEELEGETQIEDDLNLFAEQQKTFHKQIRTMQLKIEEGYDKIQKKRKEMEVEQKRLEDLRQKLFKHTSTANRKIKLNVGGTKFTTLYDTLTQEKGTFFSALFSEEFGQKPDEDGEYFIDRDPTHFQRILNYFRKGELDRIGLTNNEKKNLMDEIEFYQISSLLQVDSFDESVILDDEMKEKLTEWKDDDIHADWRLIYRATRDGFLASQFHAKCDGKGETLTVIKSTNNNVFGGYTPISWDSNIQSYVYDSGIWLFSLKNSRNEPIKFERKPNNGSNPSIYCHPNYGPTFGTGHDLYICDRSNVQGSSYSNLGSIFTAPCLVDGSANAQNFLAGSYNFQTKEIEVFAKV